MSTDTKGNIVKDYQDTTIFGEGSIQKDRSARFTGKPYDEDLQTYVFPYRNYDASTARWRSSDLAGYLDGINQHFYAAVPTSQLDINGLWIIILSGIVAVGSGNIEVPSINSKVNVSINGYATVQIQRESNDKGIGTFSFNTKVIGPNGTYSNGSAQVVVLSEENSYTTTISGVGVTTTVGVVLTIMPSRFKGIAPMEHFL